jgi:hypothetical protein
MPAFKFPSYPPETTRALIERPSVGAVYDVYGRPIFVG